MLTDHQRIMTLAKTGTAQLTSEEWKEMNSLREAINLNPSQVHPSKMEKFTELFVRSLEGKSDSVPVLKLSTEQSNALVDAL
jgi:hypothetical protein